MLRTFPQARRKSTPFLPSFLTSLFSSFSSSSTSPTNNAVVSTNNGNGPSPSVSPIHRAAFMPALSPQARHRLNSLTIPSVPAGIFARNQSTPSTRDRAFHFAIFLLLFILCFAAYTWSAQTELAADDDTGINLLQSRHSDSDPPVSVFFDASSSFIDLRSSKVGSIQPKPASPQLPESVLQLDSTHEDIELSRWEVLDREEDENEGALPHPPSAAPLVDEASPTNEWAQNLPRAYATRCGKQMYHSAAAAKFRDTNLTHAVTAVVSSLPDAGVPLNEKLQGFGQLPVEPPTYRDIGTTVFEEMLYEHPHVLTNEFVRLEYVQRVNYTRQLCSSNHQRYSCKYPPPLSNPSYIASEYFLRNKKEAPFTSTSISFAHAPLLMFQPPPGARSFDNRDAENRFQEFRANLKAIRQGLDPLTKQRLPNPVEAAVIAKQHASDPTLRPSIEFDAWTNIHDFTWLTYNTDSLTSVAMNAAEMVTPKWELWATNRGELRENGFDTHFQPAYDSSSTVLYPSMVASHAEEAHPVSRLKPSEPSSILLLPSVPPLRVMPPLLSIASSHTAAPKTDSYITQPLHRSFGYQAESLNLMTCTQIIPETTLVHNSVTEWRNMYDFFHTMLLPVFSSLRSLQVLDPAVKKRLVFQAPSYVLQHTHKDYQSQSQLTSSRSKDSAFMQSFTSPIKSNAWSGRLKLRHLMKSIDGYKIPFYEILRRIFDHRDPADPNFEGLDDRGRDFHPGVGPLAPSERLVPILRLANPYRTPPDVWMKQRKERKRRWLDLHRNIDQPRANSVEEAAAKWQLPSPTLTCFKRVRYGVGGVRLGSAVEAYPFSHQCEVDASNPIPIVTPRQWDDRSSVLNVERLATRTAHDGHGHDDLRAPHRVLDTNSSTTIYAGDLIAFQHYALSLFDLPIRTRPNRRVSGDRLLQKEYDSLRFHPSRLKKCYQMRAHPRILWLDDPVLFDDWHWKETMSAREHEKAKQLYTANDLDRPILDEPSHRIQLQKGGDAQTFLDLIKEEFPHLPPPIRCCSDYNYGNGVDLNSDEFNSQAKQAEGPSKPEFNLQRFLRLAQSADIIVGVFPTELLMQLLFLPAGGMVWEIRSSLASQGEANVPNFNPGGLKREKYMFARYARWLDHQYLQFDASSELVYQPITKQSPASHPGFVRHPDLDERAVHDAQEAARAFSVRHEKSHPFVSDIDLRDTTATTATGEPIDPNKYVIEGEDLSPRDYLQQREVPGVGHSTALNPYSLRKQFLRRMIRTGLIHWKRSQPCSARQFERNIVNQRTKKNVDIVAMEMEERQQSESSTGTAYAHQPEFEPPEGLAPSFPEYDPITAVPFVYSVYDGK